MVTQTGHYTVVISWTAPSVPPRGGYRIKITNLNDGTTDTVAVALSPQIITIPSPGVYNFNMMYLSDHLPGRMVVAREVIIYGEHFWNILNKGT